MTTLQLALLRLLVWRLLATRAALQLVPRAVDRVVLADTIRRAAAPKFPTFGPHRPELCSAPKGLTGRCLDLRNSGLSTEGPFRRICYVTDQWPAEGAPAASNRGSRAATSTLPCCERSAATLF